MSQVFLAGAVGIGPTQTVLETAVLPLYDAPKRQTLFGFFVFCMLLTPSAKLLDDEAVRSQFLIFSGMIVDPVTNSAFHGNQIVL